MQLKNVELKVKVGLKHLGLSIFDPNLGSNNPALLRVFIFVCVSSRNIYNKKT